MTKESDQQQLAEDCAQHMYKDDTASKALGMVIEDVSPGCASVVMTVRDDMVNGHNTCHGGMVFSLADSAFAFACNSHNQAALAASCSIDFLRPAFKSDVLTATAEMIHQGGRNGIYNVTITNQNADVIALFKGNSARIKRNVLEVKS